MTPVELSEALVAAAKRAGADAADALTVRARDVSVSVRGGALEEAESTESLDYGLRVLLGRRQASVAASDPSPGVLDELAARAVAMARAAPEDPWAGLADPADLMRSAPDLALVDAADPASPAALQEMAERVEAAAAAVPGVSQVESSSAGWRQSELGFVTSSGFAAGYARTSRSLGASAVAGEGLGMETDYDAAARAWAEDLPAPEKIGARAGRRAAERLSPRRAKTGGFPVLFDRRVSASLIGHILSALNGAAVARGASWLKDAMGTAVLPDGFDLIDDPHRPRGLGSRPFDGEGMAMRVRHLIQNGTLAGWTMDSATARQLGLPAPGGARRGIGAAPSPGTSSLELAARATRARADLIRDMGEGVIITSLIGSSVSQTTGAYSRGASGFWVEKGEIAYPVNEFTLAGSLPDLLKTLVAADDADRSKSTIVPSLLVEGLTVASG